MTDTNKAENPMARYVSVYAPQPFDDEDVRQPARVNWHGIGATDPAEARQFAAAILAAADEADRINAGGAA